MNINELSYLDDDERVKLYNFIIQGNKHIWSKGKLVQSRFNEIADAFMTLAEKDPIFLAHFTSWAMTKQDSKDLKVLSVFFNSLSDADGTNFITLDDAGNKVVSDFKKPNLRIVSHSALQMLDPKLAERVIQLARMKFAVGAMGESSHYPRSLQKALKKYLKYREMNPNMIKGIKKAGLGNIFKNLYRLGHVAPSTESAEILRWSQKDGREIKKAEALTFKGLNDIQIAEKIRAEKLSPMVALGMLPKKISPVIAIAVLEQSTGNQAVILQSLFADQGLLEDKEIQAFFAEKLKTAKETLDRVDRINSSINQEVKKAMNSTKASKRKEAFGDDLGSIYLNIDISSSMNSAIQLAKDYGATIAECVPLEKFHWGVFNSLGKELPQPKTGEKGEFMQLLYGIISNGMTDCFALYERSMKLGCNILVYITDEGHNGRDISTVMKYGKPSAVVIVNTNMTERSGRRDNTLERAFQSQGIPVTVIPPSTIKESALIVQAIKTAMKGQVVMIDEIMNTELLTLPKWYEAIA